MKNIFFLSIFEQPNKNLSTLQLLCTFYMDPNTYGSLMAFIVGLVLRIGGGEQQLNFEPFIPYPGNEDILKGKYNFPYKTLAMVSSLVTTIVASWIAKTLFTSGILSPKWVFVFLSFIDLEQSRMNSNFLKIELMLACFNLKYHAQAVVWYFLLEI